MCNGIAPATWGDLHNDGQRDLAIAGASYAYFWRHPDTVSEPAKVTEGATYIRAASLGRTALSMDINAEAGHAYSGEYEGRAWQSHPSLKRVNIAYMDGTVASHDGRRLVLKYPAGQFEELLWFDIAHQLKP